MCTLNSFSIAGVAGYQGKLRARKVRNLENRDDVEGVSTIHMYMYMFTVHENSLGYMSESLWSHPFLPLLY